MTDIDIKVVREIFDYDPQTGLVHWKIHTHCHGRTIHPGDVAGGNKEGYIQIGHRGKRYRAHRLAWAWMTGEQPPKEIDHIDRNPCNNRWKNLRSITRSRNNHNSGLRNDNKTGVTGVSWCKDKRWWAVRMWLDGRLVLSSQYKQFEEAVAARRAAEERYGV